MKKFNLTILTLFLTISISFAQDAKTDLWNAIKQNDIPAIEKAIEAGAEIDGQYEAMVAWEKTFSPTSLENITPLMWAVLNDHYDATLKLLQLGAKPQKVAKKTSKTAITLPKYLTSTHKACIGKKISGISAIYFAVDHGNIEITKLLLSSKKAISSMPMTVTSIGACMITGNKAAVMDGSKMLNGANQVSISPKQIAKWTEHSEMVELLKGYKKTDWYKAGIPK